MRTPITLGCVLVLLAGSVAAQDRPGPQNPRQRPLNTYEIMSQIIPDVQFQDTPLDQVITWLQELTKLNINTRWQILKDAGINQDKPITIQAHKLPLTQVLWLIMNEAGGTDLKLAYRASGNLLIFSTADDLNKEMVTKVYDIADLLVNVPIAANQAMFNVTQGMGQNGGGGAGGGGGGGGGGMFQQGQSNQQMGGGGNYGMGQEQTNPTLDKLVNLIRDTIEPDTWRENGGQGTISPFQKLIIVRNTILVHQRLGGPVTDEDAPTPTQ